MKHGQRTQAKAKDVKKTTPKKGSASSARNKGKGASSKESSQRQPKASAKAPSKAPSKATSKAPSKATSKAPVKASKTGGAKASSQAPPGRGAKPAPAAGGGKKTDGEVTFTNPAVASAFKRALKKYPVALKRLSD